MRSAFIGLAAASAFALFAGTALAQTGGGSMSGPSGSMSGPSTGGMQHMGKSMHHMDAGSASMHTMPATVTSVDAKTGIVEATSEGMSLKVHFPPASLANVKSGDKITLHLGFSKP